MGRGNIYDVRTHPHEKFSPAFITRWRSQGSVALVALRRARNPFFAFLFAKLFLPTPVAKEKASINPMMNQITVRKNSFKMKKIKIYEEAAYLISLVILSLSVAMIAVSDFGMSMIVSPAYLLSLKFGSLTFGRCEYIVQAFLFIILCVVVRKIRPVFFFSFFTGIIYGAILDLWRLIPILNPDVTPPGSPHFALKAALFAVGVLMTSFSIALAFRSYLYPQVYDFFVKAVPEAMKLSRDKFKIVFDFVFLAISIAMSFILFGKLTGVGVGTVIMALVNGVLIGAFGKLLDKHFIFVPAFKKLSGYFEI